MHVHQRVAQVCLLGSGSIIGDMSVRDGPGGPARRSATVVALTELLTYKVPLREFKRRMPADVLEVRGLDGVVGMPMC
jgi:CRP-like cAMP-binding protein